MQRYGFWIVFELFDLYKIAAKNKKHIFPIITIMFNCNFEYRFKSFIKIGNSPISMCLLRCKYLEIEYYICGIRRLASTYS